MPNRQNTIVDVLERLVICEPAKLPTGCWEWSGSRMSAGYGTVSIAMRQHCVHRLVFEHFRGAIPADRNLDHLCRNRICANPDHLEPVTPRENLLRGEGVSGVNARKTHCPVGHPLAGENLRREAGRRLCRICKRATWRKASAAYAARQKARRG